jgi:hypothetical protein
MIEILRNKIWVDGKLEEFTVIMLILVPAIPAIILGTVLLGFNPETNAISDVIERFQIVSWAGFITLTSSFLLTFYCLDKATDYPPKMTKELT